MSQGYTLLAVFISEFNLVDNPFVIFFQISLLDECGSFERALGELRKKELKIVSWSRQFHFIGFLN